MTTLPSDTPSPLKRQHRFGGICKIPRLGQPEWDHATGIKETGWSIRKVARAMSFDPNLTACGVSAAASTGWHPEVVSMQCCLTLQTGQIASKMWRILVKNPLGSPWLQSWVWEGGVRTRLPHRSLCMSVDVSDGPTSAAGFKFKAC